MSKSFGFKVYWFLGFSVSKCLGFLVSEFIGFNVYWFQSVVASWFQSFNDPILSKNHSTFSGRFWSLIQYFHKNQFHVFSKILLSYSRFSRNFKMNLHDLSVSAFFQTFTKWFPTFWDFQKWYLFKNTLLMFLNSFEYLGVSENKTSWLWESGTRPKVPKSWWWAFCFPNNEIEQNGAE